MRPSWQTFKSSVASTWPTLQSLSLRTALTGVAMVLLLFALLEPRWVTTRDSYDFVIAIDITQSMNVLDYEINGKSLSRLDYAKHLLRETLPGLPCGSRVGWGIFTEYRMLLLVAPIDVCDNYHELLTTLDLIDGRMSWTNSSEIAKGLFWGLRTVKELGGNHGFVFITDGHESPPLNPEYKPVFAGDVSGKGKPYMNYDQSTRKFEEVYDGKPGDIRGLIIGVGGDVLMPIPKVDSEGRPLGFWQSHEVMQTDVFFTEPLDRPSGDKAIGEFDKRSDRPLPARSEHLSSLRGEHLREIANDAKLDYHRLSNAPALLRALTAPKLARPAVHHADVRILLAGFALAMLVAVHLLGVLGWSSGRNN